MKTYQVVPTNFIAPVITPDQYVLGSSSLPQIVLRENGDWSDYLPKPESQIGRIETSMCATANTINCIEIIMEERGYGKDFNYSDLFIAILSGTTQLGNNPHTVAETIRKYGLIPEEMLPFTGTETSWAETFDPKRITPEMLAEGEKWLKEYSFGHEWVFTSGSITEKQTLMKHALTTSPLGVSVAAWYGQDDIYINPGVSDNHWTGNMSYKDLKKWVIFDSYDPYVKDLDWNFPFGFCKRYHVEKIGIESENKPTPKSKIWLYDLISRVYEFVSDLMAKLISKVYTKGTIS